MMAAFLASSAFAIELPENVLGANCLKDYQTKYLKIEGHKAFAFGRDKATGKVGCGWSYGYENIEETKTVAVKQCAKYISQTHCKVVDIDGQFMLEQKSKDFLDKLINKTEKSKVVELAKSAIVGNCLPFFNGYLKDKEIKVFAYAIDADGKHACGKTHNHTSLKLAREIALKSCEKNKVEKGKNGPTSPCEIYAEGNRLLLKRENIPNVLSKEVSELLKLSKATGNKIDWKKELEQKIEKVKVTPLATTLALTAKTLNKNLPEMLDDELRFDMVQAVENKMMFFYTLVHHTNKNMSSKKLNKLLYEDVKRQVCDVPSSKALFKRGMRIDYIYRGIDMKKITMFSFNAKVCGEKLIR